MQSNTVLKGSLNDAEVGTTPTAPPSFLTRISTAVSRASAPIRAATTLHPCLINGVRTLIHRRGLHEEQPGVFQQLKAFASANGFKLIEDRRKQELQCRDERRRIAPVLMFAAGLVTNTALADDGLLTENGATVVPTIEIVAQRQTEERPYLIQAGKRYVSAPYDQVELILGVAAEVRAHGELHRVRTRGVQMPAEYGGSFIDRYDYQMPQSCGGKTFSYYEGERFAALGYHADKGKVVLDVLAGGGPFTAPRLWGAYDQVLNSNIRMDLMFGDGQKDGMGLLKASYKIGLMPIMRTSTKNYYGELYSRAVTLAAKCSGPALPKIRHAGNNGANEAGDAS